MGAEHAHDHPHRRRLAGAVAADEPGQRAGRHARSTASTAVTAPNVLVSPRVSSTVVASAAPAAAGAVWFRVPRDANEHADGVLTLGRRGAAADPRGAVGARGHPRG